MHRRFLLLGLSATVLAGCARLRASPVPVVREGFVVRRGAEPAQNMTAFLPEGDTIFMSGAINADTVAGFEAVRRSNPKARRVVFTDVTGETGSTEALAFGRALREAGFATHLRNDSVITGGAVDAFVGGTQRTLEDGAVVAVAPADDPDGHRAYAMEMLGGDGYARYASEFGSKRRPRPMTIAEIGAMGIVSANVGNVIAAN